MPIERQQTHTGSLRLRREGLLGVQQHVRQHRRHAFLHSQLARLDVLQIQHVIQGGLHGLGSSLEGGQGLVEGLHGILEMALHSNITIVMAGRLEDICVNHALHPTLLAFVRWSNAAALLARPSATDCREGLPDTFGAFLAEVQSQHDGVERHPAFVGEETHPGLEGIALLLRGSDSFLEISG